MAQRYTKCQDAPRQLHHVRFEAQVGRGYDWASIPDRTLVIETVDNSQLNGVKFAQRWPNARDPFKVSNSNITRARARRQHVRRESCAPETFLEGRSFGDPGNPTVSGARWFKDKGMGGLTEAIEFVEACRRTCEWSRAPWAIENPVSTLGSYWHKPDFSFHPHEFGGWQGGEEDDYLKRTCLWTGGGFKFPEKREIPAFRPLYIRDLPPSEERASVRSVTPPGFARAVFEANVGRISIVS